MPFTGPIHANTHSVSGTGKTAYVPSISLVVISTVCLCEGDNSPYQRLYLKDRKREAEILSKRTSILVKQYNRYVNPFTRRFFIAKNYGN